MPLLLLLVAAGVGAIWSTQINSLRLATVFVLAPLVLYPGGVAISHAIEPPPHEELRDVLKPLQADWRPDDILYVSGAAQFALRYYAECDECDGLDSGPLRELILKSRTRGRDALQSNPPSLIVGNIYNNTQYETYLSDFARLRNHDRVWLVFSSAWDASFTRLALDCLGRRVQVFEAFRATAYLYDLRRARSNDCLNP